MLGLLHYLIILSFIKLIKPTMHWSNDFDYNYGNSNDLIVKIDTNFTVD